MTAVVHTGILWVGFSKMLNKLQNEDFKITILLFGALRVKPIKSTHISLLSFASWSESSLDW